MNSSDKKILFIIVFSFLFLYFSYLFWSKYDVLYHRVAYDVAYFNTFNPYFLHNYKLIIISCVASIGFVLVVLFSDITEL